ncbi:unnamed protein product [Cylicocyclus nassatus]|uniref:Uncharacterized protein n=1 Tax=Cylicocyclus nassatus TaxID=53992 RepID=A0AA36M5E4_CYLNA|nr:unnamed protein product [Cylicocyclus nassatus]
MDCNRYYSLAAKSANYHAIYGNRVRNRSSRPIQVRPAVLFARKWAARSLETLPVHWYTCTAFVNGGCHGIYNHTNK